MLAEAQVRKTLLNRELCSHSQALNRAVIGSLQEGSNKKTGLPLKRQSGYLKVDVQRKQVQIRPVTFRPNLTIGLALS